MKRLLSFFKQHKEQSILLLVLLISGVLHAVNMFHFPYYENDEGAYMSQAWSLVTMGKLAPYTYWYDHAPAGWIFIALWSLVSGGFFTFGASINSGRVFMLILHLLTTYFLYSTTKRVSKSTFAAVVASVLFSISPLGIYFQRRVLLDNIMIFWVFFSLWLLLRPTQKLHHIILSSIAFGISVLSKENAIFFLPGFLYVLFSQTNKETRKFAFAYWLGISFSLISLYFLYALIKTELFPPGVLGSSSNHVSLISTLEEQLSRGSSTPFWSKTSEFRQNLSDWLRKDATFLILGIIATIIDCLLAIKVKALRLPAIFSLFFWLFLLRGKLVIVFYIIPLLPFLAMEIGSTTALITNKLSFQKKFISLYLMTTILVILGLLFFTSDKEYLTKDETTPSLQTLAFIKKNVPTNAKIVIDDSLYVDLHAQKSSNDPVYPNAEWVWKVEKDPTVFESTFSNDWKNIQYITLSHEMLKQIKDFEFPNTKEALDHSVQLADFANQSSSYRNIPQYISTNGDWMSVYKVIDKDKILLETSWSAFKSNYVHSYGQIIDPLSNQTTSTLQGEAMLRATWIGDRDTFDGLYSWTKDHFGYRGDHLFSSTWGVKNGKQVLLDSDASTTGDETIAFALLIAGKKWNNPTYLKDAKNIMNDIYQKEVKGGYLAKGPDDEKDGAIDIHSLQPAMLHMFAENDPAHPWNDLLTSEYATIQEDLTNDNSLSSDELTSLALALSLDEKMFHTKQSGTLLVTLSGQNNALIKSLFTTSEGSQAYQSYVKNIFNEKTGIFGDSKDISLQHASWVVAALHTNTLPLSN